MENESKPLSGMSSQQKVTRVVNVSHDDYDVYIGRASIWGNPFVIGRDGSRAEVIERYEWWLTRQPALLGRLFELKGKVLGCHCKPSACHGDVLARMANRL